MSDWSRGIAIRRSVSCASTWLWTSASDQPLVIRTVAKTDSPSMSTARTATNVRVWERVSGIGVGVRSRPVRGRRAAVPTSRAARTGECAAAGLEADPARNRRPRDP